jgi:hypothetical protein
MRKGVFTVLGVLVVGVTFVGSARAQVFTPTFNSPRLLDEIGLHLSNGPGDVAAEGIWRGGRLGLRLGYSDAGGGRVAVGGEIRNPIRMAGAPVGVAFTAGAQGLIGATVGVGVQAGLSVGPTLIGQGLAVTPYLHPRVGLVNALGRDDVELQVLADVGADVEFYNNLLVRLGIKLDDAGSNWGVGFGIRR